MIHLLALQHARRPRYFQLLRLALQHLFRVCPPAPLATRSGWPTCPKLCRNRPAWVSGSDSRELAAAIPVSFPASPRRRQQSLLEMMERQLAKLVRNWLRVVAFSVCGTKLFQAKRRPKPSISEPSPPHRRLYDCFNLRPGFAQGDSPDPGKVAGRGHLFEHSDVNTLQTAGFVIRGLANLQGIQYELDRCSSCLPEAIAARCSIGLL